MSTEHSPPDLQRSTIVSRSPGLAYERMREVRQSHFSQPLARKLSVQGAMLVALAAAISLSVGVGTAGGVTDGLVTLGAGGGALVVAGVTAHGAVGGYRLRREPLTEREALALLTVEDAASYLGIVAGGLLVAATVATALVGLVTGSGPAAAPSTATAAVLVGASAAAALALGAARFFRGRLPDRR